MNNIWAASNKRTRLWVPHGTNMSSSSVQTQLVALFRPPETGVLMSNMIVLIL